VDHNEVQHIVQVEEMHAFLTAYMLNIPPHLAFFLISPDLDDKGVIIPHLDGLLLSASRHWPYAQRHNYPFIKGMSRQILAGGGEMKVK